MSIRTARVCCKTDEIQVEIEIVDHYRPPSGRQADAGFVVLVDS
jgi:hypothetical protein